MTIPVEVILEYYREIFQLLTMASLLIVEVITTEMYLYINKVIRKSRTKLIYSGQNYSSFTLLARASFDKACDSVE